jgi:hypothetical protein
MTKVELASLMKTYNPNTTLKQLMELMFGELRFICPKCSGKGGRQVENTLYNSGGMGDGTFSWCDCNLCKGEGYTEKEYKPTVEITGYKEK